jgi:hypothetical protein
MQKNTPVSGAGAVATAIAAAAALALAGCGSSASSSSSSSSGASSSSSSSSSATNSATSPAATSPGSSASVPFPVAVGDTWTYNTTAGGESGTTVNKMTAVTPVTGGQQVTMTNTDHLAGVNTSSTETYIFHSDGSISYPLGQLSAASGVTVSSGGIVWPPASVIDSGTPTQSDIKLSIKEAGQAISTTAHVTVQGAGTASVTVPAGTYQATVVLITEQISIAGVTATVQVKTWLAPNVGPVKDQVTTTDAGASTVAATEELVSFTQG